MTNDLDVAVIENFAVAILIGALVGTEREKHDTEIAIGRIRTKRLVSIEDVGAATAVIADDDVKLITAGTVYVDGGDHILG